MATQIKPRSSGSYTTITVNGQGLASKSSTGLASATWVPAALRGINEWHNAPGNTTSTARAAKTLAAVGILVQEV